MFLLQGPFMKKRRLLIVSCCTMGISKGIQKFNLRPRPESEQKGEARGSEGSPKRPEGEAMKHEGARWPGFSMFIFIPSV